MRAAAALSSTSCIILCAPGKQQWPIFYQCRGLCSLPRTYEMLVKGCGPELVDQSRRFHEMGGFLDKFGVDYCFLLAYPAKRSFPPVFLPCPYSFFQRRSVGVSRIAPNVYTSHFSASLFSIMLLLLLQCLRLHFI